VLLWVAASSARSHQKRFRLSLSWQEACGTLRAAWPFGAAIIIFTLQARVSFLVLAFMLGAAPTGLYASSLKFVEFGVFPLVFLALATYPNLSRYHRIDPAAFRRLGEKLYRISLIGGGILGWGLVFVVPHLIVPLFGRSFADAVPILRLMAILGLIMAADIPASRMMLAAQLQNQRVLCMLAGVLVNISLAVILVPMVGVRGAVAAAIAGQAASTFLSLHRLSESTGKLLDHRSAGLFVASLTAAAMAGWLATVIFTGHWVAALVSLVIGCITLLLGGYLPWSVLTKVRPVGTQRDSRESRSTASLTRLRICFLVESYHPVVGGMEAQARILAEDFTAAGHDVMVLTRRSDPALPPVERTAGITVYRLPPTGNGQLKRWGLLATALPALVRKRREYDVVHVMGFRVLGAPTLLLSRFLKKKCVLRAETDGEMSGEFFAPGLRRIGMTPSSWPVRPLLRLRNRILRRGECFVSISSAITDELIRGGIAAERILYIPNSVDTRRFTPANSGEKEQLRRRFGFPANAPLAIFTGRLVTSKGLPVLLAAWRELLVLHSEAILLLVGGGGADLHNCEAQLKASVAAQGMERSVRFTGDVVNVHDYLRAADLFVFPTEMEAVGISLIEAMACGLPVVSTLVGGLVDIVVPGENGLAIEPGDNAALCRWMTTLIDDPAFAAKLGRNGLRTVTVRFAREMVASRYLDLMAQVMGREEPKGEEDLRGSETAADSCVGYGHD
jgi:glycosyltransferase involved in cell wall biosynthesis